MRNFQRWAGSLKLRNKLLISYLLVCLFPLLFTTFIVYRFSVKNLEEESMELAVLYSSQIVTNIDRFIEEYDGITKSILVDNDTLSLISERKNPSIIEQVNDQLQMRRLLMRIAILRPDVDNIMLLSATGKVYQYSPVGASVNREALLQEQWLEELMESDRVLTITGAHTKSYYDSQQDGIAVTIGRQLYDASGKKAGVLLIDMNPFELVEMNDTFKSTRSNYHIRIYVSSAGVPLYDSDVIDGKTTWAEVINEKTGTEFEEGENIVIRDSTYDGTLDVWAVIPRKQLMGKATNITIVSAAAIGFSLFLILVTAFLLSKRITRPLTQLQKKMVQMGEGDYSGLDGYHSSDEIGTLVEHYNRMAEKIKGLINDVYLAQIKQKDAKLMALRTQINPHMLYNTLESIRMKALVKGDVETASMIKILAKMFRASLGKEDEGHTIREELAYVENYILLQNIRFQDQFDFVYEVDPELMDMKIIPMVFQPIVENCIEHGNRGNYQKLHIHLYCRKESAESIQVIFQDDGCGMEPSRMEQINRQLQVEIMDSISSGEDMDSIGLRNIAERIFLRYGKEYYLKILSSTEKGTIIEMRIPLQRI